MPIHRKTPKSQIERYLYEAIKRKESVILRNLAALGEACVNVAKSSEAYKDQTGNLRSSVGYIILKDGKIVVPPTFRKTKDGEEGTEKGKAYIRELIKNHSTGFVLIVVAGMNYAAKVEASGRDVISSAELYVQDKMPQILKNLKLQ